MIDMLTQGQTLFLVRHEQVLMALFCTLAGTGLLSAVLGIAIWLHAKTGWRFVAGFSLVAVLLATCGVAGLRLLTTGLGAGQMARVAGWLEPSEREALIRGAGLVPPHGANLVGIGATITIGQRPCPHPRVYSPHELSMQADYFMAASNAGR